MYVCGTYSRQIAESHTHIKKVGAGQTGEDDVRNGNRKVGKDRQQS